LLIGHEMMTHLSVFILLVVLEHQISSALGSPKLIIWLQVVHLGWFICILEREQTWLDRVGPTFFMQGKVKERFLFPSLMHRARQAESQ